MAKACPTLIVALRQTAERLQTPTVTYDWANFAHCNCGQLAQTLTGLAADSIYRAAVLERGDWAEQAVSFIAAAPAGRGPAAVSFPAPDYDDRPALDEGAWEPEDFGRCETTDRRMSDILVQLLQAGLEKEDIANLERLADGEVRRRMGTNTIELQYSKRENVVAYLQAWAEMLEEQLTVSEALPLAAE